MDNHTAKARPLTVNGLAVLTGRDRRTVVRRLQEANCYPLDPSFDRGDILALFDDGPLPTCTAAEEQKISARIDALLAKERACKRGKPEGTR